MENRASRSRSIRSKNIGIMFAIRKVSWLTIVAASCLFPIASPDNVPSGLVGPVETVYWALP